MIRAAFLSFYRSLTRHPLYSALNLLGLSFGIAVFIVLSLYVRFETSYEQWLPNADRIYEIVHRNGTQSPLFFRSAGYALDAIRETDPELTATRLFPTYPVVHVQNTIFGEAGQLVDLDFFHIFNLPVVAGDRDAALAAPDGLILSERMARKYFGSTDVLGKTLDLHDDIGRSQAGKSVRWRVMAVVKDIPHDSTLKFDLVRSLPAFRTRVGEPFGWYAWGSGQEGRIFLELPSADEAEKLLSRHRSAILAFPIPFSDKTRARVQANLWVGGAPFKSEHLSNPHLVQALSGLTVTAWLTLAAALFNYVNLATARASLRFKEIAVRNVHGASAGRIGGQLLIEGVLSGSVSLVVAFSFVEIYLPELNRIAVLSLGFDYSRDWIVLFGFSASVLTGALIAGLYPTGVLAFIRTTEVLGAPTARGYVLRGRQLREGLSIAQLAIASTLLVVTAGFAMQIRYMETSALGFSRENLLVTDALVTSGALREQAEHVVKAWRHIPGIEGVSGGQAPGEYYMIPYFPIQRAGLPGRVFEIGWNDVSADFFRVYHTRLLAGRAIDEGDDAAPVHQRIIAGLDIDKSVSVNVDIDSTAVKALGFKSPQEALGKNLLWQSMTIHIVGVVPDQRFQGPMKKKKPTLYVVASIAMYNAEVIIRYSGMNEAVARQRLEAAFRNEAPDLPYDMQSMHQKLDYYYRDDRRNARLFAIGGGVAALIGAVGLFGMAAFNTSARVHEIGIRKAQGASRWRIMRLLMFQFLRPVLIANIIAWPIAYVVLDAWLKQFDDRVAMSPLFFLAGSGLSLLIAAVTVCGVAWSGANLSPAKALRQL